MDDDKPPPDDLVSTQTFERESGPPQRIGNYRILQKLGEGGMGVVYLAEQEEPIRRRVALKIIKLGMDTKAVIARFEAERQALAMMNHPNVAKVFEAGTTEQGRPFFVMEYVKGVPLTTHCDRQKLSTTERLRLFMQICEGVQHAHQKGIIHRDLKPSNVLVAIDGEKAVPKIIDFGVAKATENRLTEQTVFTQLGQIIGTPEYMSPEQAEMTAQDIDTRTDVYSMGVILYELLAGALPFDPKELRRAGFDEVRRKIREEEPSKPSTRVSDLGNASRRSAEKRQTDPASLSRQLRGDLDWITMQALEKDRTRRYATVSEFAADIQRHMNDEPVSAGPPSRAYRLRKFIKRNREAFYSATCLLAAVFVLGVVILVQYVELGSSDGDLREREHWGHQKATDLWIGLVLTADSSNMNALEVLQAAEKTVRGELPVPGFGYLGDRGSRSRFGQPESETWEADMELKAEMFWVLGQAYTRLGHYDDAIRMFEDACRLGSTDCEYFPGRASAVRIVTRMSQNVELPTELRKEAETLVYLSWFVSYFSDHDLLKLRVTEIVAAEFYNLACAAANRGDPDEAVRALQRILNLDTLDEVPGTDVPAARTLGDLAADPRFADLRDNPDFEAIVAEAKKRIGEE